MQTFIFIYKNIYCCEYIRIFFLFYFLKNPRHAAAWNELEETGLLSMRLVEHVFTEFLCDGQSQTDILCMMEMYGLIAKFTPENAEKSPSAVKYFVPAQLCSCPETELDTSPTGVCPLYINFPDGFLPHGLFPQLVSRFISVCPALGCRDEPNLFQNLVRFILGGSDLFLICKQSFLKVILQNKEEDVGLAAQVRERLESILCSLSRDFACLRNMRYEFCVICPSCSHSSKACTKHKVQSCTHSDCVHFLPISDDGKLICRKTFGARSRVEVSGLEEWRGVSKKVIILAKTLFLVSFMFVVKEEQNLTCFRLRGAGILLYCCCCCFVCLVCFLLTLDLVKPRFQGLFIPSRPVPSRPVCRSRGRRKERPWERGWMWYSLYSFLAILD